jgi:hypothetical protein
LMEELSSPALSLSMELANAHNVRCQLMAPSNAKEAESECRQSLDILDKLVVVSAVRGRPEFRNLLRDLGYNFVDLARIRLAEGSIAEAQGSLANLNRLLPEMPEPDRRSLTTSYQQLQRGLQDRQVH